MHSEFYLGRGSLHFPMEGPIPPLLLLPPEGATQISYNANLFSGLDPFMSTSVREFEDAR